MIHSYEWEFIRVTLSSFVRMEPHSPDLIRTKAIRILISFVWLIRTNEPYSYDSFVRMRQSDIVLMLIKVYGLRFGLEK